jgi:hypothetical protein
VNGLGHAKRPDTRGGAARKTRCEAGQPPRDLTREGTAPARRKTRRWSRGASSEGASVVRSE